MKVGEPEIVAKSYSVEIEMELFARLLDQDPEFSLDFINKLEKLGAYKIDWDGHFGNSIFFSIDTKYEKELPNIVAEIRGWLDEI